MVPPDVRAPLRLRRGRLPRQLQPDAIRLSYFGGLRQVLGRARELVEQHLVPQLPSLVGAAGVVHDAVGSRGYAEHVTDLLERISTSFFSEFTNRRLQDLAARYGHRASTFQRQQLAQQFASGLGIDITASEPNLVPRLQAWAAQNASLIKSVPQRYFGEIEARTLEALRTGKRAEDIAGEYAARYGVSESRALLIARDQIGKLNGQLNIARQDALGVKRFTWRTAGDERVREEHEALEGKVFDLDDPPSEGYPGDPIACRCGAEPVLSDVYAALGGESEPPAPGGWTSGGAGGGGPGGGGGGSRGGGSGGGREPGDPASSWHPPGANEGPPPPWMMTRGIPRLFKGPFDVEKERKIAVYLAEQGNDVVALERPDKAKRALLGKGGKWPDAMVNGRQVDFKTMERDPLPGANMVKKLKSAVGHASGRAQSSHVVIDARGVDISEDEVRRGLQWADKREFKFVRVIGRDFDVTMRAEGSR
jgi:SPP1 gp7 family putative phage head morphogenesis protein